jgi:hypothetical protein
MAWLWDSWQEFAESVQPNEIRPGRFRQCRRASAFQVEKDLLNAVNTLNESLESLRQQGFGDAPKGYSRSRLGEAFRTVAQTIRAGEELLLYHKRLALSEASRGFLSQHDLLEHWDRYAATDRIALELQQLIEDVSDLLDGYRQMSHEDESLIVSKLDVPESLERDFRLSRNLFSVGFEEVGLLIAGRGLEGVLREIARLKKILFEVKGKPTPACEADFFDLIEIMSRVRWKVNGTFLLPRDTKALLHYLRTIRNSGAHPAGSSYGSREFRETAILVANTADRLWRSISSSRARVDPTTVQKSW